MSWAESRSFRHSSPCTATRFGYNSFSEEIAKSLSTIAGTEAGGDILRGIVASKGEITFEYRRGVFAAEGEWFGKNSTIYFDPNHVESIVTSGNIFRNANTTMVLSHELCHAWNNAASGWFGSGVPRIGNAIRGLPGQEMWATRHTNLVRRQLGYKYIRTHYSHNGNQFCVEGC
ncbi:M91 family zinc metallopeptidase [Microbulbifer sp. 2205BS26-8]|uniref:M91 family zinc metallopeptidase n=1 Tax=Microbulbifer sp. 2205BS26-8 TaxID=3064386 RepID=UPI00273F92B9|nr:M91 family zinc metallopeptidase [Microbulbifer sp. 2205BS26-8]MDP5209032.1 M91 family zinc metallopeptidase [Microbulbifer sp. 2205BS26-8]